jgi:energy-coupling factor transporter ATP-binding protein EcfA2
MSVEPLRVELETFCQQFTAALEPFSQALDQGTETLRAATDGEPLQTVLSDLQDNRHRLKILLDKASEQNTYLVIFGPLKSGKSTLMNAISGAYVSEVSSLPAYPCLVYVKEGESHGFSTTAFNGDQINYDSHDELHGSLEAAHEALAKRLRQADAEKTPFNPAQDFTEAIRRIDFTMPAPYLQESGTILVDTPGLYTKMKYSYGQLTRDFRDTAACAVFVVKTDNLFFEQVFEEFADLLDVFSRVFLVVNIDSSKQDLSPDGSLKPSLERDHPERIFEAFENLTVSAQIRSAIDSGRLRIYMIDLLQTAARSLKDGGTSEPEQSVSAGTTDDNQVDDSSEDSTENLETDQTNVTESAVPAAQPSETAVHSGPRLGFENFLQDLTEYLNSNEYITEFMADSLRQARSILLEVKERTHAPEIAEFRAGIESLQQRMEEAEQRLRTLDQVRNHKWAGPLEELSSEIRQQVTEHYGSVLPKLEKDLHGEVEAWAETDESMRDLIEDRICAKISDTCKSSRARATELFDSACRARNGGVRTSDDVGRYLQSLDLSFDEIYTAFQPTVRERFETASGLPDASGIQEALPLRKRFIDWILLRSETRLRRHILGADNPSERPIPSSVKAKRLDGEAISELCGSVSDYARRCCLEVLIDELEKLLREYSEVFQLEARKRLDTRQEDLQKEHDDAQRQVALHTDVIGALDELEAASDQLNTQVVELDGEFIKGKQAIDIEDVADDPEADPTTPDFEEKD